MCIFARPFWLTIFKYGQTFGVFAWNLTDDQPLYLSRKNISIVQYHLLENVAQNCP